MTGTLTLTPITENRPTATFNVVDDFGAKGDGVTDDTSAIQAAITAAIAVGADVEFPEPPVSYRITSTLSIVPAGSATQAYVNLIARGKNASISWAGGNNSSVFRSYGWKYSRIKGLKIDLGAATSAIAFDVDVDSTRSSSGELVFENCLVSMTGASSIGWRAGHSWTTDVSFLSFVNCIVTGNGSSNQTGWVWENLNCLQWTWLCSGGGSLAKCFTNVSTSGAAQANGGDGMSWFGCGASANALDFELATSGTYAIYGGRWELGQKFLEVNGASTTSVVTIAGVILSAYAPGDGQIFRFDKPGTLTLDGIQVISASSDYTSSMVRVSVGGSIPASVVVRNCSFQCPEPFFNADGAGIRLTVVGSQRINSAGQTQSYYNDRTGGAALVTITYSATMATDASLGEVFKITATNGTAFTISNPTNAVTGKRITYVVRNTSGGALGAVTWGTAFKLATWSSPATGNSRSISFVYDGTNWVETSRTPADVPN